MLRYPEETSVIQTLRNNREKQGINVDEEREELPKATH